VGPHPAVAAVRLAVRRSLAWRAGDDHGHGQAACQLKPADLVLVACSGGADSLALAAAVAFEAPRAGMRPGGIVVDHGLQAGSAEVAAAVAATMARLGLEPVLSAAVSVAAPGAAGYAGPEAAARAARYDALDKGAAAAGAAAIMLGHTLDDQAETVLLGLARGSGARSLAGMAGRSDRYLRPLLGLRRAQTRAACAALGLEPWDDPQNDDLAYRRVRVRHEVLPLLETALGPGVAEALARSARLLRADADLLDQLAAAAAARIASAPEPADTAPGTESAGAAPVGTQPAGTGPAMESAGWPVAALAAQPAAIRQRILRNAALAAGCAAGALSERHVASIDELVTDWHGQRWTDLPDGIRCERRYGRLLFTAVARSEEMGGRE
jgi:tRNA(Ile)-lysidine synthase